MCVCVWKMFEIESRKETPNRNKRQNFARNCKCIFDIILKPMWWCWTYSHKNVCRQRHNDEKWIFERAPRRKEKSRNEVGKIISGSLFRAHILHLNFWLNNFFACVLPKLQHSKELYVVCMHFSGAWQNNTSEFCCHVRSLFHFTFCLPVFVQLFYGLWNWFVHFNFYGKQKVVATAFLSENIFFCYCRHSFQID